MKTVKFEEDCEIPFKLDWLYRCNDTKYCGVRIKGRCCVLSYVPIPDSVRYANASFVRYLKSDEGQKIIKEMLSAKK